MHQKIAKKYGKNAKKIKSRTKYGRFLRKKYEEKKTRKKIRINASKNFEKIWKKRKKKIAKKYGRFLLKTTQKNSYKCIKNHGKKS